MFGCSFGGFVMEMFTIPTIFLLLASVSFDFTYGVEITATCNLYHYELAAFVGQVNFTQESSSNQVTISGCVSNIPPGNHGFHVHQFGAITSNCLAAGGHFNPENKTHGDISDTERHVGDLGNLNVDDTGSADFCFPPFTDTMISLLPGRHSIIGRSLALHRDEDDLGRGIYPDSKTTGHSGPRIACCVIGLTSDEPDISHQVALLPFPILLLFGLLSSLPFLGVV